MPDPDPINPIDMLDQAKVSPFNHILLVLLTPVERDLFCILDEPAVVEPEFAL